VGTEENEQRNMNTVLYNATLTMALVALGLMALVFVKLLFGSKIKSWWDRSRKKGMA
jgi:uncharacterized membrane protein YqjE